MDLHLKQVVELCTKNGWDDIWLSVKKNDEHIFTKLADREEYFVDNGGGGKDYMIIKTSKQVFIWRCTIGDLGNSKFLFMLRLYNEMSFTRYDHDVRESIVRCICIKLSIRKYLYIGRQIYIFETIHGGLDDWGADVGRDNFWISACDKQFVYYMNELIYVELNNLREGNIDIRTINKYPKKNRNGKQIKLPIYKMKTKILDSTNQR